MSDPVVYVLHLPADSRLPRKSRTVTMPTSATFLSLNRTRFEPPSLALLNAKQRVAWFHFITGYQHLLFLWTLTAECCGAATYFVGHQNWNSASIWIRRAARLMLGCAAGIKKIHNIPSDSYLKFSGNEMSILPAAFTEEGFAEYQLMKVSLDEVSAVLSETQQAGPLAFKDTCLNFFLAMDVWSQRNADPNSIKSGLNVVPQQLPKTNQYDHAFGITRIPEMFVEEYHYALRDVINNVQHNTDCSSLDTVSSNWLDDGNKLMNAIVEELLDPPTYRPNA